MQGQIITTPERIQDFYRSTQQELLEELKVNPVLQILHRRDSDYMRSVRTMVDEKHQLDKIQMIEKRLGFSLKGLALLEIGSGIGDFVVTCRRQGISAFGIEPHDESYGNLERISKNFLDFFGISEDIIQKAWGEKLPHADAAFDVVFSYYTFEHVGDPLKVLQESVRVLKPGGHLLFIFPNYGSFWEGHYGVPWPAFAPQWLGKVWIRLLGFKPDFIDTLQLIDLPWLKRLIKQLGNSVEVLTLGKETFVEEVSGLSFTEAGSLHKAKALLGPLKRMGILSLLARTAAALGVYTPFYLTLRKK